LSAAQQEQFARVYPLPAYAVNNFSVHAPGGWLNLTPGQYIVQPPMAAVSITSYWYNL